jgi:hypothetical protein
MAGASPRPRDQICTARCAGRVSLNLHHLPLLFCAILWRGPRSMDLGAPRPIEAKRRKSLILKDFPRIAAAGFSAEDKDHVSNKHWSFFFYLQNF